MVYEPVWISNTDIVFAMIHTHLLSSRVRLSISRGFTLIELLAVITIVALISTIVLANHNLFKGTTILQNLGYDIALSVRQAQVYGISVVRTSGGKTDVGYGVHFATAASTQYRLFADSVTRNGTYDTGEDVSPSPFNITGGYYISKLCVPAGASIATCTSVPSVDVFFIRPEPDAYILKNTDSALTFDTTGVVTSASPNASTRVVVSSAGGQAISVIIDQNGQISVTRL